MIKRIVAVPLWFVSIWLMYGLVAYFLGLPNDGGAILGALVAALVSLDPTGTFWGTREGPIAVTTGGEPARAVAR